MNLTPHRLDIVRADGSAFSIAPSGVVARVAEIRGPVEVVDGVEIRGPSTWGEVTGLPPSTEGALLVVSALVAAAVSGRQDIVRPGELIRGADGQPVGCRGLIWAA